MLILSRRDVEQLLDPRRLLTALADAMTSLSEGRVSVPPRVAAAVEEHEAFLGAMPAYLPSAGVLESKLVAVFPHNAPPGPPSHQAVIVAFDPSTGTPLALMDATHITEVRTAVGSALATSFLAREDASVMALIGTGVQARGHARSIPLVRKLEEIRVAGRDERKVRALSEDLSEELGLSVRACASYAEAIAGADIVCATTHSPEPVVRREWLSPGVHLNAVGFNREGPEVDAATVVDAIVVVESRAAALAPYPAGAVGLTGPISDGLITPEHIHAEVGELVTGARPGRTSPDQITLYQSVGVGVQDAAAVDVVLRAAEERGVGLRVEL